MYHPAAALRSGEVKLKFTMDFEKLPAILEKADSSNIEVETDKTKVKDEIEQMHLI